MQCQHSRPKENPNKIVHFEVCKICNRFDGPAYKREEKRELVQSVGELATKEDNITKLIKEGNKRDFGNKESFVDFFYNNLWPKKK